MIAIKCISQSCKHDPNVYGLTLVEVLASLFLLGLISLWFYQALGFSFLVHQKTEDWRDMRTIGEALLMAGRALADDETIRDNDPLLVIVSKSPFARQFIANTPSMPPRPEQTPDQDNACLRLQSLLSPTELNRLPYDPLPQSKGVVFVPLTAEDWEALRTYLPPSLLTVLDDNHTSITACYWLEPIAPSNGTVHPSPLYHLAFLIGDHERNPVIIDGLVGGLSP
ncbi:MAG: hypothetical protein RBR24_09595 [Candidatus Carbobacillus sp.]|nr:hypothetical protein [Candidatus Carbobacillus sp.]